MIRDEDDVAVAVAAAAAGGDDSSIVILASLVIFSLVDSFTKNQRERESDEVVDKFCKDSFSLFLI